MKLVKFQWVVTSLGQAEASFFRFALGLSFEEHKVLPGPGRLAFVLHSEDVLGRFCCRLDERCTPQSTSGLSIDPMSEFRRYPLLIVFSVIVSSTAAGTVRPRGDER